MALFDLLGRRWALRVLWELRGPAATFRELRERTGSVSPSVLNVRLRELREGGLVELAAEGYRATRAGRSLLHTLKPLDRWALAWASRR